MNDNVLAFRIEFADGETQFAVIHAADAELAKNLLMKKLYCDYKVLSIKEEKLCDVLYEQYYDIGFLTNYVH